MKTYNQMFIEQFKYELATERAVNELERVLNNLINCKRCSAGFLPEPRQRQICEICKYYVDNKDDVSVEM